MAIVESNLIINEPFGSAFAGRSVLVTGHTGFKGSWLSIWLHLLGAQVAGYSLAPPTRPSNFGVSNVRGLLHRHIEGDVRSLNDLQAAVDTADPDVIFHLAAQPLVRESYQTPRETFDVNFMGTCNLLEAVRLRRKPCVVIVVTSDKCYENLESHRAYREEDAMGGHDPYSASKGAAELLVASYGRSFFPPQRLNEHGVKLASARAGNVIGGGDWACDRIVPDIVAHLSTQRPVPVRNPEAVRPWQHVLEPLSGYLTLAAQMLSSSDAELCGGWNFGPSEQGTACVGELVTQFCAAWEGGEWRFTGDPNQLHEAKLLRLSIKKAEARFGWRPVWKLDETVERTIRWYRAQARSKGQSMLGQCIEDIAAYSREYARLRSTKLQRSGIAAQKMSIVKVA
jgi:CDP-glucose 4,6-dehydratase